MRAFGLDIGGTKIETQVFAEDWSVAARNRVETPDSYDAFISAIADQITWARGYGAIDIPIGIGAAGVVHPKTGLARAANIPINGQPVQRDIEAAVQAPVAYINDCDALAVSESKFGAGRGYRKVVAVILGTGVGGGATIDGQLIQGAAGLGGDYGHVAASAAVVSEFDLPIWPCGCGRKGCIETYLAGPGLQRLAKHMTGQDATPEQIAAEKAGVMGDVWAVWYALAGEFIHGLALIGDPDVIVLGGGLSRIDGLVSGMAQAAQAVQIDGFGVPPIVLASGGDTSGAKGAAYTAWLRAQETQHG